MKRIPSIALALALCLSLTVPACAANQSDNTAITDSIGNTYTLSNSVLYTLSRKQAETIDRSSMKMFLSGFESDEEAWTGSGIRPAGQALLVKDGYYLRNSRKNHNYIPCQRKHGCFV
ncbi:hypothetical protein [Dysosmobacter welbionis]|uniref:hypothetical protein n=1 Tax=Dysosmobacter welbionis TaxID=2093857 RepID=UPI00300EFE5C